MNSERNKVKGVEMEFHRRSCRMSRSEEIRNKEIRKRVNTDDNLIQRIDGKHFKRMEDAG